MWSRGRTGGGRAGMARRALQSSCRAGHCSPTCPDATCNTSPSPLGRPSLFLSSLAPEIIPPSHLPFLPPVDPHFLNRSVSIPPLLLYFYREYKFLSRYFLLSPSRFLFSLYQKRFLDCSPTFIRSSFFFSTPTHTRTHTLLHTHIYRKKD